MNKKGASLSGWTEGILFSVLFVFILTGVITSFNLDYGGSNALTGLNTNNTFQAFSDYQSSSETQIAEGEAQFSQNEGLSVTSSWGVIKAGVDVIWNFLTGNWIEVITTDYMQLDDKVGFTLRILYFISLVFIILAILFRRKP